MHQLKTPFAKPRMTSLLPFLDLSSPDFSTRSTEVADVREQSWCARTPFGLAIVRHKHAGLLLRDKRVRQGSHAWPNHIGITGSFAQFWKRSIISQEGDFHRMLRHTAVGALSEDFIASLAPQFTEAAAALADTFTDRTACEFMAKFATPFSGQAVCIVLGLPLSDWSQLAHDASDLGLALGVNAQQHEPRFDAAYDRLRDLADSLIDRMEQGHDTTSYAARLATRFKQAGHTDPQVLNDMIVISIFGGVDTTRSQLGHAMALFAAHPDQWQTLRNDRSLMSRAIDETLRHQPTTTWVTREVLEDFIFDNVTLEKGQTLHILVHATSQDPAISPNHSFDITCKRKPHHGFGGGAHHCLGHFMARTDMTCALNVLADRFSTIEVTDGAQWLPDSGNTGPLHLPLAFTPA